MRRSPGIIPITYEENIIDEYGNTWIRTDRIGTVRTDDILELKHKMEKIQSGIKK